MAAKPKYRGRWGGGKGVVARENGHRDKTRKMQTKQSQKECVYNVFACVEGVITRKRWDRTTT